VHAPHPPSSAQEYSSGNAPHHFSTFPSSGDGSTLGNEATFNDMMIESQDIDMSAFGDEMMPWLEYLPHDVFGYFESSGDYAGDSVSHV
jgi:hypothetical protein